MVGKYLLAGADKLRGMAFHHDLGNIGERHFRSGQHRQLMTLNIHLEEGGLDFLVGANVINCPAGNPGAIGGGGRVTFDGFCHVALGTGGDGGHAGMIRYGTVENVDAIRQLVQPNVYSQQGKRSRMRLEAIGAQIWVLETTIQADDADISADIEQDILTGGGWCVKIVISVF